MDDMNSVRYPVKRNILLNPGPATTTDTVKFAQVVPDICPREREFGDVMRKMAAELVRIVHGDTKLHTTVFFCGSGTVNIDAAVSSLLPENRKILVVNNGSYSARAAEVCKYYGLPHVDLKLNDMKPADPGRIEEAIEKEKGVAVVYACHHETGTGLLNPVKAIGEAAHRHGCTFIVDTTSTYAMIPIDIERDGIDFLMSSAQKGLSAITGLSFIIGRRDLLEASKDYPQRSYYCNLYRQHHYFETRGEMNFTPPVQAVYAARQAIEEYWAEGESAKWERHRRVWHAIASGVVSLGMKMLLPLEYQSQLGVAALYPDDPRWDFERVHDYCYERGFTIYPGKTSGADTFRLCALGAIDTSDIDDFFAVFREALAELGM